MYLCRRTKLKVMANKRDTKKNINYIVGDLFTECLILSQNVAESEKEKVDKLMGEILSFQDDFLKRTNHIEPGNKEYFKTLREDFNKKINDFIEAIGKLN